ncbi:MAG: hypothetical protein II909_03970 [Kiritimatiellae bacterium]|nr:hypothetical protein [Kiritimatiellia bacterium]
MLLASISAKGLFVALALSTDLFSLLGGENDSTLALLNAHLSDRIRVLCTTADAVRAAKEVAELDELPDVDELLSYYAAHGGGLLSPRDRERLEKGEYEKIRRSITRMDYGGMGLVPKADDPCYFTHGFLVSLMSRLPKPKEGGVILTGRANHIPELVELAHSRDDVFLSGAPFHAYLARRSSIREINILSLVSVSLVLAIGFWLFRDFRFVIPTALTLLAGFAAGTLALFVCFSAPHVLTFLFGTSLIGLGVDYCYHGKNARLKYALATTLAAFLPLFFSHVAILRQMAVFTVTGLVAIFLCVSLRR